MWARSESSTRGYEVKTPSAFILIGMAGDQGLAASYRGLRTHIRERAADAGFRGDDTAELLRQVIAKLAALPAQLRQSAADAAWASIPFTVQEWAWSQALAQGGVLAASPQTAGLELIQSIVVSVPTGATGVVQLGINQLPVPAGVTVIAPVAFPVGSSDTRSLTITGGAGAAALILSGTQQPTYGALAH